MADFLAFLTSHRSELVRLTAEHIVLTVVALFLSIVVGVSLGIGIRLRPVFARPVLAIVNTVQTIPSLALLGLLIPLLGIGKLAAIVALFLYALLPIVRNTYTGLTGIAQNTKLAAKSLGLTTWQQLRYIEIPLAMPYFIAGIRVAAVLNVGVATLAALIAAGGLGTYLFRGIALNNDSMLLAGAIPASLLALLFDYLLGLAEKQLNPTRTRRSVAFIFSVATLATLSITMYAMLHRTDTRPHVAGFNGEFVERVDGLQGLQQQYSLAIPFIELDISLMYDALYTKEVDLIAGFSTEGRIESYHLRLLRDDKNYFPPYYAAPVIRSELLASYPLIEKALNQLANRLPTEKMRALNAIVDTKGALPEEVARAFLDTVPLANLPQLAIPSRPIRIASKAFTENFIVAEIMAQVLEHYRISVERKTGFGGTKLLVAALEADQIDLYPEYTGTGFLVVAQPSSILRDSLLQDPDAVYTYADQYFRSKLNLTWLKPFGFNNTTALMVRESDAERYQITTISDLTTWYREGSRGN